MPSRKIVDFFYAFRDIAALIQSSTDPQDVSQLVVWRVTELLGAKGAVLSVMNMASHEMELHAVYGLDEQCLPQGLILHHEAIARLCKNNCLNVTDDLPVDCHVKEPRSGHSQEIAMVVDAPMCVQDNLLGVLRIFFSERRTFIQKELDFISAVAHLTSCALEKARLIEEQKRRYDQLALHTEKFAALGRMAAGIAHEVNNPLASILLYSSNALKKVASDSPLREALKIIVSETQRCRTVLQDLLEFSRDREPRRTLENLNKIIERVLVVLQNELMLHHVNLHKHLASDMPDTLLDRGQMQQVFVNILLNAVEAMSPGGNLEIQSFVDRVEGVYGATIRDDGCGIDPEVLNKIFEPFFSTKPKGTGLGLAVCHGIIKAHGGEITAQSTKGKGACFTITLPLDEGGP